MAQADALTGGKVMFSPLPNSFENHPEMLTELLQQFEGFIDVQIIRKIIADSADVIVGIASFQMLNDAVETVNHFLHSKAILGQGLKLEDKEVKVTLYGE